MATLIPGLSKSTPLFEQRLKLEINFLLDFVLLYPLIWLFLCRILLIIIKVLLIGGQIIENASISCDSPIHARTLAPLC